MKLKTAPKKGPEIPTCSMADIAFLLIIFFMLTTVFVAERGIRVTIPAAKATKKLPKKNITHIWVSSEGAISIDDNIVTTDYVGPIMGRKVSINPNLIVSIVMDKDGEYGVLSDILDQFKDAKALKVSFSTLKEKGG
ncbi:biopolymer transporter ExbD [candidate division WOR-3 bacterium]|nr:biopolymer transporter ExbD [candidate division WOR-3 bacterium]